MEYGIQLLFENLNTEHFTFTSELYNSAMGGSYLLWGMIFKIINWFSVFPWVVHFFNSACFQFKLLDQSTVITLRRR